MNEDLEVKNIGYVIPKSQITVTRKYGVSPRELLDIQKKKHERDATIALQKAKQRQKDGLNVEEATVPELTPREIGVIKKTKIQTMVLGLSKEICDLYEYLTNKNYTTEEINIQIRSLLNIHVKKFQEKNIQDGGSKFSCFVF